MTDIIDSITSELLQAGRRIGISQDKMRHVAASLVEKLHIKYGGGSIYISARNLEYSNNNIKAEFTGNNIPELSRKHGISKRTVSRIVNKKG